MLLLVSVSFFFVFYYLIKIKEIISITIFWCLENEIEKKNSVLLSCATMVHIVNINFIDALYLWVYYVEKTCGWNL
jgi:hypothetical protein